MVTHDGEELRLTPDAPLRRPAQTEPAHAEPAAQARLAEFELVA